jgi:heme exporter protein D
MMVDLGDYAVPVISAYISSIVILTVLIWASLARSAKVKRELEEFEAKRKSNG